MSRSISRRTVMKGLSVGAVAAAGGLGFPSILKAEEEIKVGFIGPISGFYALQGTDMLQCTELAVDEINQQGAAGGRKLKLFVEDNKLEPKASIDAARKLIHRDGVDVIIGVLASSSRVAALSVTEPADQLFIYPTFYEGGECRRYLIVTGTVPNQSVDPSVPWLIENVGKRIYVVGNDFEYPRGMAALIKAAAEQNGGQYVGEEFYPFGTSEYGPIFQRIKEASPDVVWVMDAGQPVMVQQYHQFGMEPQLFASILHENWTTKTEGAAEGVLANASYFTSVDTPENKKFLADYRARFGDDIYPTTFGESQYDSVWLYAKAVAKAGSADKDQVRKAITEVDFLGPQGRINVVAHNQHARTNSIIGRVNKAGLIDIVKEFGQVDPDVPGCNLAT